MRVVFAGTPEVALPALDAVAASGHELVGVVTRPDAPSGRGRRLVASPVAQRAEELGVPVLKPEHPRDPGVPGASCARSRPTAARSSPTAPSCRSRRSTSRRTAGSTCTSRCSRPGAARRRCSTRSGRATRSAARRRSGSSRSSTPGPTFGVMTETDPPDRHRRRPARPGSPRAGPGCSSPPSTASPTGRLEAREQQADGVSFAPKITVEDARIDWAEPAVAVDRRIRACTPAPGAWTHPRRRADQGRPGHRRPTTRPRAGRARGRPRTPSWSAPAPHAVRLGEVKALRQASRCPPPTGPAAPGSSPAPASVTLGLSHEPPGHARGRRRDLRRPARDRARHLLGRRADLEGAGGREGQGVRALPAAAQDGGRPRDGGDVRRPARDHHPDRGREAGAGRGRLDRRSSPSTTSATTTRCWSSSRALGELERDDLAAIITDAWATRAPKRLVREHLGDG